MIVKQRQICDRSIFDGGTDDPRKLVYWYQQRMRAQLLAKARRPWWSAYVSPLRRVVRTLMTPAPLPESRAPRAPATPTIF